MAKIIIGSARIDENSQLSGGKTGDQKQKTTPDYSGEVSLQNFYVHKKGWYILRPLKEDNATGIAAAMMTACNNPNIGYDQNQRLGVISAGVRTTRKTECDCSSLVRACIIDATNLDPGNFTTGTEATALEKSGLFQKRILYKSGMELFTGDVLVTKTKGHTVIVVAGLPRGAQEDDTILFDYFPRYVGTTHSIVDALISLRINASKENRAKIAAANGIKHYTGTGEQNTELLALLKCGKLLKP